MKEASVRSTETNIKLFRLFAFLNRLDMWNAVHVLFLLQRGFSLTQYSILDSLWYVGTLVFEVPTGALTDRCGKKVALLLAVLLQGLAFITMITGRSFLALCMAFVVWGLTSSLETGTYSAFLYESLKQVDGCRVEPALARVEAGTTVQFERLGYFCADPDGTPDHPVFNRTVGLRDAWARLKKQ